METIKRFAMWHPTEGINVKTVAATKESAWMIAHHIDVDAPDHLEDFRRLRERDRRDRNDSTESF